MYFLLCIEQNTNKESTWRISFYGELPRREEAPVKPSDLMISILSVMNIRDDSQYLNMVLYLCMYMCTVISFGD